MHLLLLFSGSVSDSFQPHELQHARLPCPLISCSFLNVYLLLNKSYAKELMLSNCGAGENWRVPWTARGSNQSIVKEISPEYSLERLRLKLKLQYFGHLMQRTTYWKRA